MTILDNDQYPSGYKEIKDPTFISAGTSLLCINNEFVSFISIGKTYTLVKPYNSLTDNGHVCVLNDCEEERNLLAYRFLIRDSDLIEAHPIETESYQKTNKNWGMF